jgi:hypothetical protein
MWRNKKTGAGASIYGAVPWTSSEDKANWEKINTGFTVYNEQRNTIGIGRAPWKTRGEAEAWIKNENTRMGYDSRRRDAEREPDQSDLNAAARGLNMLRMGPSELEDLIKETAGKTMFASKAVHLAAKQMLAAKRRMGARDATSSYAEWEVRMMRMSDPYPLDIRRGQGYMMVAYRNGKVIGRWDRAQMRSVDTTYTQVAFKGYLITNSIFNRQDFYIKKGGANIGTAHSLEEAKKIINELVGGTGDRVRDCGCAKCLRKDALNHLGEREYQTYSAWRAAAKAAGATRFEGDKDIAAAIGADGKHVGEWGGDKGSIYTK